MTEYGTFYLSCFNPRLRTGGDDRTPKAASILLSFNPRLRTGGDAASPFCALWMRVFQSTPPHGRRRRGLGFFRRDQLVSIHASAREATVTGVGLRG